MLGQDVADGVIALVFVLTFLLTLAAWLLRLPRRWRIARRLRQREKGFEALYGFTVLKTISIKHD